MNIIRTYPGQRIAMPLFCLISLFHFTACQKKSGPLGYYTVYLNNQYFESIDSVLVDGIKTTNTVDVNETVPILGLKYGGHTIQMYTSSRLRISSEILLIGSNNVDLILNNNGSVEIRNTK